MVKYFEYKLSNIHKVLVKEIRVFLGFPTLPVPNSIYGQIYIQRTSLID
jgi:hypothetical protein